MGEIDPITGAQLTMPGQTPVVPTPTEPTMPNNTFAQADPYNTVNPKAFNTQAVSGVFGMQNPGTFTRTVGDRGMDNTNNYTR